MYKILRNKSRKAGVVFGEMDANFLAVCNAIIKLANPALNLKGFAETTNEPSLPEENDCYLVIQAGTIWTLECEKYDIIVSTASGWELADHKLTELNAVLQSLYFSAENIAVVPPAGMSATDLQTAINELAAVVFPES